MTLKIFVPLPVTHDDPACLDELLLALLTHLVRVLGDVVGEALGDVLLAALLLLPLLHHLHFLINVHTQHAVLVNCAAGKVDGRVLYKIVNNTIKIFNIDIQKTFD